MRWTSWMSLGIIVTCLAWIAQRLVSSRSPTKYASAASSRVNMACALKCMSYFPTSRAISQTSCEKGIFWIRSSVLFWNQWISQRATIPSQYFWDLFTFPAFRNSFWGALPPTVGQSFLLASSLPPNVDGPASTSILANCHVSDDSGDLPTSSSLSASLTLCSNSSWVGAYCSISGAGRSTGIGGFFASTCTSTLILTCRALLPSPIHGVFFVLAMLEVRERESANQSPEQSHKSLMASILNF